MDHIRNAPVVDHKVKSKPSKDVLEKGVHYVMQHSAQNEESKEKKDSRTSVEEEDYKADNLEMTEGCNHKGKRFFSTTEKISPGHMQCPQSILPCNQNSSESQFLSVNVTHHTFQTPAPRITCTSRTPTHRPVPSKSCSYWNMPQIPPSQSYLTEEKFNEYTSRQFYEMKSLKEETRNLTTLLNNLAAHLLPPTYKGLTEQMPALPMNSVASFEKTDEFKPEDGINAAHLLPPTCTGLTEQMPALPMNSIASFQKVENLLLEDGIKNKLVEMLGFLGGKDCGAVVRNIMKTLLTNKLAQKFNWAGRKGKRPFQNSRILESINRAIYENHQHKFKQRAIKNEMQRWLKHAPMRYNRTTAPCKNSGNGQKLKSKVIKPVPTIQCD